MKKIITAITIGTILSASALELENSSHYCKDAYKEKLQRIDKNRVMRTVGKIGVALGGVATLMIAPVAIIGPVATLPAFIVGPIVGGAGGLAIGNSLDREAGLLQGEEFLSLAQLSNQELKELYYKRFVHIRAQEIFGSSHYDQQTVDYVKQTWPIENYSENTLVSGVYAEVNSQRRKKNKSRISYDDFLSTARNLSQDDTFCPVKANGKSRPLTLRRIIKKIAKQD